jgi:hypothetical protein
MDGRELSFDKDEWIQPYPDIATSLGLMGRSELLQRRDDIHEGKGAELTAIERVELKCLEQLIYRPFTLSLEMSESLRAIKDIQTYPNISYDASRAVGEAYERGIVAFLMSLGIPSRRYEQTGIPLSLMRAFQRDIYVRDVDGLILNIELKALKGGSYLRSGVLVGAVGKWDDKRFRVAVCLIVHQQTGAILWTRADKQAQAEWKRYDNRYGASYLVPYDAWKPLEELVTALGYML